MIFIKKGQDVIRLDGSILLFKRFDESSVGRIMQHCKNGFFAISAERGDLVSDDGEQLTGKELKMANNARTKRLEGDIRRNGLGFITTLGGYGETREDGSVEFVDEVSKFVPYLPEMMSFDQFEKLAFALAKKYNQDAVIIGEPVKDSDGNSVAINAKMYEHPGDFNYKVTDHFNNIDFKNVMQYYTKLKKGSHSGKKFVYAEENNISDADYILYGYRYYSNAMSRHSISLQGEFLYRVWEDVFKPCYKFNETSEEREKAVYASDDCKKTFLENCNDVDDSGFTASKAVDAILDGTSVKEAILKG